MPSLDQILDHLDHLGDVLGGAWVLMCLTQVQQCGIVVKNLLVSTGDLERIDALLFGLLLQLVLTTGICDIIDGEMPHVGDVHHLGGLQTTLVDGSTQQISQQEGAEVTDVRIAVDGGTTVVHADLAWSDWLEIDEFIFHGVPQSKCHLTSALTS